MSNVTESYDFDKVPPADLTRFIVKWAEAITRVVNGGIELSNLDGKAVVAVFTAADTDTPVAHGLGRKPSGYITIGVGGGPVVVYFGAQSSDSTNLIVRSSVVGNAALFVY